MAASSLKPDNSKYCKYWLTGGGGGRQQTGTHVDTVIQEEGKVPLGKANKRAKGGWLTGETYLLFLGEKSHCFNQLSLNV